MYNVPIGSFYSESECSSCHKRIVLQFEAVLAGAMNLDAFTVLDVAVRAET